LIKKISDTTAATLTNLFYELASSPTWTAKLQSEIDAVNHSTYRDLAHMPLLSATIDETLRLHPPLPSGMQRVTPPQGIRLDDVYIPGDCIVQMPLHTLFRGKFSVATSPMTSLNSTLIDERCFAQPTKFIPERWTTQPELVKDRSAYIPFGSGKLQIHSF
jgi:cytochrome P450